jgi:hypothetical protein
VITYYNKMETSRHFEEILSCKRVKYQVLEADKNLQNSTELTNLHVMYHMLFGNQQRQFW